MSLCSRPIAVRFEAVTASGTRSKDAEALEYLDVEVGVFGEEELRHEHEDTQPHQHIDELKPSVGTLEPVLVLFALVGLLKNCETCSLSNLSKIGWYEGPIREKAAKLASTSRTTSAGI